MSQYVTISCSAPRSSVRALMDADPPVITAGYGGWEEVARPGRRSLVAWDGSAPYRMSLAIVFDGWREGASVDADCGRLERMASFERAFQSPPKVRVSGVAVPKASLTWRIDELTWGEMLRDSAGNRLRQHATLTLVQDVPDATVKVSKSAQRRHSGRTVKLAAPGGQVALQRLAAKELGSAKRWKEIAKLNGIRTPKKVKAGTLLRLP